MLKEFKRHIDQNFPFLRGNSILLACSGGLDSVTLAYLCKQLDFRITLAHCNFNLRGEESNGDEAFVRNLAADLRAGIEVKSFDVTEYIKIHVGSVQMAARELRYKWFNELLESGRFGYLLTAHHADDALETFLINLSRGTGIDGLSGILAQNGKIIRPLLPFSRIHIGSYAQVERLEWREDSSNLETKYLRNKIRHDVVPGMKKMHPAFLDSFIRTQNHLKDSVRLLEGIVTETRKRIFVEQEDRCSIAIAELEKLEPLEGYLYALFNAYGFSEWDDVKGLLSALSGKEVRSRTHRLVKDREHLILTKIKDRGEDKVTLIKDLANLSVPIPLKFETVKTHQKTNANVIFVDKEKLNYPLLLRKWQKGDYFYPFGMRGKKKLSKYFKDEKIDVVSKENQWLLCSGDDIVWVVGRRPDERYRVDDDTQNILKISLLV
ncbi:tRNA lysidine(34) synthetase TilS [Flagellimonas flava]|uniref:tRNA(Ile)-lysidine synthase n=1 Tax=Flagellimonas flava TaxID=570519 RepID=A0A1M5IFV9_9FLAO|nr:tRNA lysidine(34) synthetase TilS [Allomuricauda flava]SHG26810.1 tRNA(Ile)-lysidine synthase [Allomuricauda flava]